MKMILFFSSCYSACTIAVFTSVTFASVVNIGYLNMKYFGWSNWPTYNMYVLSDKQNGQYICKISGETISILENFFW